MRPRVMQCRVNATVDLAGLDPDAPSHTVSLLTYLLTYLLIYLFIDFILLNATTPVSRLDADTFIFIQ